MFLPLPFAIGLFLLHVNIYLLLVFLIFLVVIWLVRCDEYSTLSAVMIVVLEPFRVENAWCAAPKEEDAHEPEIAPGPFASLWLHFRYCVRLTILTRDFNREFPINGDLYLFRAHRSLISTNCGFSCSTQLVDNIIYASVPVF